MRNVVLQYWRVLACLSIVFHHTVCALYGGWPPSGYQLIDSIPTWANALSGQAKAFGLDSFTFISGAVLYFSMNKHLPFFKLLWNKVKRILVPMVFFALLYKILFPNLMYPTLPAPINGTHLWYLPMVFLCIMIVSLHFYTRNAVLWIVLIYFIVWKCTMYIDFRTIYALYYYFPIFYAGFLSNCLLNENQHIRQHLKHLKTYEQHIVHFVVIFVVLFYSKVSNKIASIPNISVGLLFSCLFIVFSCMFCKGANISAQSDGGIRSIVTKTISLIDRNSFAIYLLHQFGLNIWIVVCGTRLHEISFYWVTTCIFITVLLLSLGLAESYGYVKQKIKNKQP